MSLVVQIKVVFLFEFAKMFSYLAHRLYGSDEERLV